MTDASAFIELGIFMAAQTGALIYYAGKTSRTLADHDRRIDENEATSTKNAVDLAYLKGKEGLKL
jgi:hypothetical protein